MKVRFAVAPGGAAQAGPEITSFADAAELSGFDGVWLSDVPLTSMLDPLLGLAMIAGRNRRLKLGANVVPLGRSPFLLAKELAQLDQLSGGRLLLIFVPGLSHQHDSRVLGASGATRGVVLEEVLGLVRRFWAGEKVDHESERYRYEAVASVARPVQDPLEVWLGGRIPSALDRAGRIADGWLGAAVTVSEARAARERIQGVAADAGRVFDPEHFGLSIPYAATAPSERSLQAMRERRPDLDPREILPVGADELRELILALVDAGLSKFVLRATAVDRPWQAEMEWLADAILDLQT